MTHKAFIINCTGNVLFTAEMVTYNAYRHKSLNCKFFVTFLNHKLPSLLLVYLEAMYFSDKMTEDLWHKYLERMGKGDLSTSNSGSASHTDTGPVIRSRHLSSNGPTSLTAPTLQLRKHRCPNGFSIPWFSRSQGKYTVTEKKDKELSWQFRSSAVLVVLLLTNLINYMDRYTIAGLPSTGTLV